MGTDQITVKSVESKINSGVKLTPEEDKFVMSLPPGEADANTEPGDDVDWDGAEGEDGEKSPENKKDPEVPEKKAEDKAAVKPELSARAKAVGLKETATEEEVTAAEKKNVDDAEQKDPLVRIERALEENKDLSDNQVSDDQLKHFSPREKAYFWQMRRDRRARQKAEEDRDAALFREVQLKKQVGEGKSKDASVEEDPIADLEKKDPSDFMTVADVVKIVKSIKKPAAEEKPKSPAGPTGPQVRFLKMCDAEAANNHKEDYEAVMELTEEIVNSNPAYLKQVAEAIDQGENPAEKAYQLIKSDPAFAKLFPAAQTKVMARKKPAEPKSQSAEEVEKERKARIAQEALEKNNKKTKTTGHAAGDETDHTSGYSDGKVTYTAAQLDKMTDLQFAKVPKKVRDAYLKDAGVK